MRAMVIMSFIGLFFPLLTGAELTDTSLKQLETFNMDITGDSSKEKIKLNGAPFAPDSDYYAEIKAVISGNDDQQWDINYEGGYNPAIQFYDLNHNGVKDLFYQSAAGGNRGLYHYHLHTVSTNELKEVPLPEQKSIKAKFKDGFKVEIQIDHELEPETVNVNHRSSEYEQLGIYNENGKLLDSTTPIIEPISFFEPVEISDQKGYGLKSFQHISGAYHADLLGTVETLWYYEHDKWIILETKWVPS